MIHANAKIHHFAMLGEARRGVEMEQAFSNLYVNCARNNYNCVHAS